MLKTLNLMEFILINKYAINASIKLISYSLQKQSAWLITYFGNFVFGFSSLGLCDFLYDVFRLKGKKDKTKWKISKPLHNILVTALLKTTRNEVTKIGWNPHLFPWDCFMRLLKSRWHTVSQTNKRTRFPDVTVYLHKFNDIKRGPSNYSILWKGSKLSFPLSTVLIKANK